MIFFRIGWAKPVPINARNFKNPRRDMALVGIAGPVSNLCLGIIFAFLYKTAFLVLNNLTYTSQSAVNIASVFLTFLYLGVLMNVCLAVFNMIPVPPFDGSRFIYAVLPIKWYFGIMKYERYIALAIFILLFTGILSGPISIATSALVNGILWLVGLIPIFS
jgi:Zn-dependent protease